MLDKDGDGSVTNADLTSMLNSLGKSFPLLY
jgi:Ca2+-binding EF-hand superfamily protein